MVINYTQSGTPWPGQQWWNMSRLHGLSLYFPLADEWKRPYYTADSLPRFAAATHWDELVQAWYTGQSAPQPPAEPGEPVGPVHILVNVAPPASVPINSLVYIPIRVTGVYDFDDVRGIQLQLLSANLTQLWPAADKPALMRNPLSSTERSIFAANSLTLTTVLTNGFGFVLNAPMSPTQAISGSGAIVWLPFYTGASEGCVTVSLGDHLLTNGNAQLVNHHAQSGQICLTAQGGATGKVYLQSRASGQYANTQIVLNGAGGAYTTTTNANGQFSLTGVYSGVYTATFTHPLFVYAVRPVTITAGITITVPDVGLWAGDIDQNGDVDQRGWYIEAAAIYPVNDPAFDINGDGVTNIQDTTIVSSNIGRPNMPFTNPPLAAWLGVQAQAQFAAMQACGQIVAVPQSNGDILLRAVNVCGQLEAVGARLAVSATLAITGIDWQGEFASGFYSSHRDGDKLYIVAAPRAGAAVRHDVDIAIIHTTGDGNGTVEAQNPIVTPGQTQIYLPLVMQNAGQ